MLIEKHLVTERSPVVFHKVLYINKLSLNFMKTEGLLFGNQSQLRNFDDLVGIRIKGRAIRRANSTTVLGNDIRRRPGMG